MLISNEKMLFIHCLYFDVLILLDIMGYILIVLNATRLMIFRVPVYLQNQTFFIRKFVFNIHFSENITVV